MIFLGLSKRITFSWESSSTQLFRLAFLIWLIWRTLLQSANQTFFVRSVWIAFQVHLQPDAPPILNMVPRKASSTPRVLLPRNCASAPLPTRQTIAMQLPCPAKSRKWSRPSPHLASFPSTPRPRHFLPKLPPLTTWILPVMVLHPIVLREVSS